MEKMGVEIISNSKLLKEKFHNIPLGGGKVP